MHQLFHCCCHERQFFSQLICFENKKWLSSVESSASAAISCFRSQQLSAKLKGLKLQSSLQKLSSLEKKEVKNVNRDFGIFVDNKLYLERTHTCTQKSPSHTHTHKHKKLPTQADTHKLAVSCLILPHKHALVHSQSCTLTYTYTHSHILAQALT